MQNQIHYDRAYISSVFFSIKYISSEQIFENGIKEYRIRIEIRRMIRAKT